MILCRNKVIICVCYSFIYGESAGTTYQNIHKKTKIKKQTMVHKLEIKYNKKLNMT